MEVSKAIGKIEVGVQDLQSKHSSCIYGGKHNIMRYFYFQKPQLDPPYFPPTRGNKIVWDEIITVDENNIIIYLDNLQKKKMDQVLMVLQKLTILKKEILLLR